MASYTIIGFTTVIIVGLVIQNTSILAAVSNGCASIAAIVANEPRQI